jgi:hypothetical protein
VDVRTKKFVCDAFRPSSARRSCATKGCKKTLLSRSSSRSSPTPQTSRPHLLSNRRFASTLTRRSPLLLVPPPHLQMTPPLDSSMAIHSGVGLEITAAGSDGNVEVRSVIPGYSAELSSLVRARDVLVKVDGVIVKGMALSDIRRMIFGDKGTPRICASNPPPPKAPRSTSPSCATTRSSPSPSSAASAPLTPRPTRALTSSPPPSPSAQQAPPDVRTSPLDLPCHPPPPYTLPLDDLKPTVPAAHSNGAAVSAAPQPAASAQGSTLSAPHPLLVSKRPSTDIYSSSPYIASSSLGRPVSVDRNSLVREDVGRAEIALASSRPRSADFAAPTHYVL